MSALNVNVPPELQADVDSWQDGTTYDLKVRQTGAGQFDLVSGEAEDDGETQAEGGTEEAGNSNPSVAIVIAKKKGAMK